MKILMNIIVVVGVICLFTISGYFQLKKTDLHGVNTALSDSLTKDVNVYYDQFGIPHIEAQSKVDLYKAFGYVMASQRLFQMDVFRRLTSGRLSEIFGAKTIEADTLIRKLQLKDAAKKQLENPKLTEEVKQLMKSFLVGVHAYIENENLPIEFDILGYKPEKFELEDIVAISGYMALSFNEGFSGDILYSHLMESLPAEKLELLRGGEAVDADYFPEQKVVKSKVLEKVYAGIESIEKVFPIFHGSNSWVLSGVRTKSGKPILANDPHIATSNPHIFYEAHLKAGDYELYGNFLPLIPFAAMGHTPYSAWGLTMAEVDDMNVYEEKVNPENIKQVMHKGEWVDIKSRVESILVRDGEPVSIVVESSPHGPIINGSKFELEGKLLSISWSVHHDDNNLTQSFYELPLAKTVEEFKKAISHGAAPPLNVSWVNNSGDIAWWMLGKFPKLADGVKTDEILQGWNEKHEIERYYTIDENPHLVNPLSGEIVSANYRPQQLEFAHFDGYWQPGGRYFRIEKLLAEKEKWDVDSIKKIQIDNVVPIYSQMKTNLKNGLKLEELDEYEMRVLEFFLGWNGESTKDSVGSSIYHLWNIKNIKKAFLDELGEKSYNRFGRTADFWHAYKRLLGDLNHSFWDDVNTSHVESGTNIITSAFKNTVSELKDKFGTDFKRWTWGKLHKAEYVHPIGRVKPLNLFFNIGPVESDGGRFVINNLGHKKHTEDFSVVHGPATRRIIDMSNPRESLGIIPTGNSGNPLSKHYKNQLKLYHSGQYRDQQMNWNVLKKMKKVEFKAL